MTYSGNNKPTSYCSFCFPAGVPNDSDILALIAAHYKQNNKSIIESNTIIASLLFISITDLWDNFFSIISYIIFNI